MSTADLPNEWNIAILTPSNFFGTFAFESDKMHYLRLRFSAMNSTSCQDTMLQVITKSVEVIVDRWQELYDEVRKECDGENVSFMDGEQYVHLLYDDGNFRRSRFYFWAIGCLSSFEQSVAETLWELSTFRKEVDHDSPFYRGVVVGRFKIERIYNQEMDFFDQACRNLGGILDQLVKKRDEMKVLRDGVCFFFLLQIDDTLLLVQLKSRCRDCVNSKPIGQHSPRKLSWAARLLRLFS